MADALGTLVPRTVHNRAMMGRMIEVHVEAMPLSRLSALLSPVRAQRLQTSAGRAREAFGDRVVWHVNATATGGGVAEMLQTLLAYGRGAQIENRWLVLDGNPEFFVVTKRLHNLLHGDPGDGDASGRSSTARTARCWTPTSNRSSTGSLPRHRAAARPADRRARRGAAGAGAHVVWRCHIGRDAPNELTDAAWAFLRPFLEHAEAFVFSRREYAPSWAADERLVVIPPSIDPFSAKNIPLDPRRGELRPAAAGLVVGWPADARRCTSIGGTAHGVVRDHAAGGRGLVIDGPAPPIQAPLVVQVSRWDRLKDMAGVMAGFARAVEDGLPRTST